jgi:hypothetical protein
MKFDTSIVKEFLPDECRKHFLVWDNIFISGENIIAIYRSPFEEKISIPIKEYNAKLIQKNRDNTINNILC